MTADQVAALLRAERFEDEILNDIRSHLRAGHFAAARSVCDIDRPSPTAPQDLRLELDGDVEATVSWVTDDIPSQAVMPLTEVVGLVNSGVRQLAIKAPPGPRMVWFGTAVTDQYVIAAQDYGGLGHLSASRAPGPHGKQLGTWFRGFATGSGVAELNDRRSDVVARLYDEYGNEPPHRTARTMVTNTTVEAIIRWHEQMTPVWVIRGPGIALASEHLPQRGTPAERIVDALSIEAFGVTRAELPRARGWEQRWSDDEPERDGDGKIISKPNMHHEEADGQAMGQRPWKALIMSEWTLAQSGPDPTGWIAAGNNDPTSRLAGLLAAGLPARGLIGEWRRAGCTEPQVRVLLATGLQVPDREIAQALKVAVSTVKNTRAAARRKIRDSSETA